MKKAVAAFIAIIMLCSCSISEQEQTTHETSSQQQSQSEEQETGYTVTLPKDLADFWNSDIGKDIIEWQGQPDYNVFCKKLEDNFALYYYGRELYVKYPDGEIKEILNIVHVDPDSILFSDGELRIPCQSGSWTIGPGNFPHTYVYNLYDDTARKEMWPLNDFSKHHTVKGCGTVIAKFGGVEATEEEAAIYFDIDFSEQTGGGLDSHFPKIDYFYNEYNSTAYFYIIGIISGEEKLKALENIEGLENLKYGIFEKDGVPGGTLLSFSPAEGYDLLGEVFAGEYDSPEDHFVIRLKRKEAAIPENGLS